MKKLILLLFIGMTYVQNYAQTQYLKSGVAVQGYDVVAYFESNKAVQGNPEINAQYNKAVYFFSNAKNKTAFLKNPAKYAPQFGGYCAYGVSENHLSPTDPQAFTIVDDKLYLNYNLEVKKMWSKDREDRIKKADANWVKINKK
ncbi:MAG TPA: YHS domain-containing (seleno)protein [Flavobacterium sp.]|uniref:YHS domain-containing (seleno)protein n=1 Tax=Flavobacterium sp. TaxID=239 RepID=UPI002D184C99|nr:YHS domain-containing (seleno)protein [Flavobacterium sp.]HNP33013.1 YHS domain-containing (seleno)protein [Flavobacterium sp.]